MSRHKHLIIVVGVLVVLVMLLLASIPMHPEVRYNYYTTISDTAPGDSFSKPDGNEWITLHIIIANDGGRNVSMNSIFWQFAIEAGNTSRKCDLYHTFLHPSYELVDIRPGGIGTTVQVFSMPKFVGEDFDVKLYYRGFNSIQYDPELTAY